MPRARSSRPGRCARSRRPARCPARAAANAREDAFVTSAESDYLLRLAGLSLSFVGFSAVVVTLRGALGGKLSDRHLRLVRLYIEGGFVVTALALLPTLLHLLHAPDTVTWPLCSAVAASIFTFVLVVQFRRRRAIEGAQFPLWVTIVYVIS